MSVIFLPPSAGAASVPDATETVSGKIRIATNAEATTGTDDTTAMTPAKTKTVVDAAVVGGVQYQGTFDASAPADLSNAEKGDLYVISGAGTYQGQVWAVGDHLLINEDMGGTVSPSKIDKVDNTDAVTSVAGKTGAVTLVPSDITGLATVASTGSYSDLSGTPTLATVATTGAYSDLTGTPSLATVATTGAYSDLTGTPTLGTAAAEDVGTSASNVVQLDGSARLPAVDGSQLLNLPGNFYNTVISSVGITLSQITDSRRQHYDIQLAAPATPITMPAATSAAIGGVVSFFNSDGINHSVINCPSTRLLSGSSVTSFTVEPYESRSFVWVGASALQEITATRIDRLNDVSVSSPSGGEALVYNGTLSVFENATITASVPNASETVAGIIEIATNAEATAATATDKALVPSNISSINVSTLNNDAGYLTNINSESLNDLSDVSYTAGAGIDNYVLTYDHATSTWGAEPSAGGGGGTAPTVSVSSPSADQTLSAPSAGVIEEVYVYSPSTAITVNLVAAATVGSGFKYQIKNRLGSTNSITIDPNSAETIDGSSTHVIDADEASVTLITDGSNWFII